MTLKQCHECGCPVNTVTERCPQCDAQSSAEREVTDSGVVLTFAHGQEFDDGKWILLLRRAFIVATVLGGLGALAELYDVHRSRQVEAVDLPVRNKGLLSSCGGQQDRTAVLRSDGSDYAVSFQSRDQTVGAVVPNAEVGRLCPPR
jgi:hypothetical protein